MSATQSSRVRRLSTETKQAFKTTEFWVYIVLLLALFIAGAVTGGDASATTGTAGEATGSGDDLNAGRTWLYAIILTVGYLLSRGLSKSGSRDPYWDDPYAGHDGNGIGDRVKQAAQVLTDGGQTSDQPADGRRTEPVR